LRQIVVYITKTTQIARFTSPFNPPEDLAMRPSRFPLFLTLCALSFSVEQVHANGCLVVPMTSTQYVLRNTDSSHGGLLRRLCGRCPNNQATGPQWVAQTVTQYAIVRNNAKPCYRTGYYCDDKGHCWLPHPTGGCFATCFLDTPCNCCHHTARHLRSGSGEAMFWQSQISQGCEHYYIQDPGHLGRLLHQKHFQRAN
jgi:hypothetical protein